MSTELIVIIVSILLIVFIGYNMALQSKAKLAATKRYDALKFNTIIDTTEELISGASYIPYTKTLLLALNYHLLDAIEGKLHLTPDDAQAKQRKESISQKIAELTQSPAEKESHNFKLPSDDKQTVVALKLVKSLKKVVALEHSKGRFDTQSFVAETARLDQIQIRIGVNSLINRVNSAIADRHIGTALQLLEKGIETLTNNNAPYTIQAKQELQELFNKLEKKRESDQQAIQEQIENSKNSDLDVLFGKKKKW